MSPEQVRAEKPDARMDLFSFGAVRTRSRRGRSRSAVRVRGVIFKAILDTAPTLAVRLNSDLPLELKIVNRARWKGQEPMLSARVGHAG
jgi:hypothetical protein